MTDLDDDRDVILESFQDKGIATVGYVKSIIQSTVTDAVNNFIGQNPEDLTDRVKKVLLEQMRDLFPATVSVEIVEEDEDMKIVRKIHEEPDDMVRLNITYPVPMKYLVLQINGGETEQRIGIEPSDE